MIRVIYVNQIDITEPTGQGVREKEMVTRLLSDHQIEGYYIGQKPYSPSPINGNKRACLIPLPKKNFYGYNRFQSILLKHLWALTKGRSSEDTVMFVRYAPAMVWPAIVSKWRNIPMVLRTGPALYNLDFYKGGVSPATRTLVRFFSGLHYRRASRIQTVAKKSAEIICKMYAGVSMDKFSVIPCASNPDIFHIIDRPTLPVALSELKNYRLVCFAGALIPNIGIEYIIRAMELVTKEQRYDDVVTVIVGDGRAMSGLQEEARIRSVENRVIFVGPQSQQYINQLLNVARAAVLPWGTKVWDEKGASPTKLYEYLAAGTLTVATRHRDTDFIEQQNLGLLCNKDDPVDMAEQLKTAVDASENIEAKQRRRDYILRHYTWDIVYQRMRDLWLSSVKHSQH